MEKLMAVNPYRRKRRTHAAKKSRKADCGKLHFDFIRSLADIERGYAPDRPGKPGQARQGYQQKHRAGDFIEARRQAENTFRRALRAGCKWTKDIR